MSTQKEVDIFISMDVLATLIRKTFSWNCEFRETNVILITVRVDNYETIISKSILLESE